MVVEIVITIVAVAYVAFSVFAQRKLANMKRVYEVQETIKAKTRELNELSKNKASHEAMAAKQKEITGLLSESMRSQFKPMFVIMPAFLVLYYIVFPALFPTDPNVTVLSTTMNYKVYFIAVAFALGIASSTGLSVLDRMKRSREKKQEAAALTQS